MPPLADLAIPPDRAIASVFLTPDCGMACRFCGSERGFDAMTQEEAFALLDRVAEAGVTNVVLGGGEPLQWKPGLAPLLERGRALGLVMQVCTNGLHLPTDPLAWPRADRFILPLEATVPALHDGLRRFPGGHQRVVLGHLEALVGMGRRVTLSTVVTRENLDEVPRLGDLLLDYQRRGVLIHAWHLYRFIPTGRAGLANGADLTLPKEAYRIAVQAQKDRGLPFPVYRRSDLRHPSTVLYFWKESGSWRTAC
jgi:MoaA/NifB/PqqE/SkfB family radical SAM enzyme